MKIKNELSRMVVIFLFLSCQNPTDNLDDPSQTTNYDLYRASTAISKSIFTASYNSQDQSADGSLMDWTLLYQLQSDGTYSEIVFKNSDNQDIRLNVTKIFDIGMGLIGIEFTQVQNMESLTTISSNKKAIIRTTDNLAFDFSEFILETAQAYKEYLYIQKDQTLYVVNISTMTNAIPLNNSLYDPMPDSAFPVSGRYYFITENYDVIFNSKTFFFDSSLIPIGYDPLQIVHPTNPSTILNPRIVFYDLNGSSYILAHNIYDHNYGDIVSNGTMFWGKIRADINNGYIISNKEYIDLSIAPTCTYYKFGEYSVYSREQYVIGAPYGFFKIGPSENSIEVNWFDLVFPFSYISDIDGLIVIGNYCYWQEKTGNKPIKRLKLEQSSSVETIVDISGVRTGFSVISGKVIFNKNISALEIYTYSLAPGDFYPILISTSEALPTKIIEFDL